MNAPNHDNTPYVAEALRNLLAFIHELPTEALGECADHMVTEGDQTFCRACTVLEDAHYALYALYAEAV